MQEVVTPSEVSAGNSKNLTCSDTGEITSNDVDCGHRDSVSRCDRVISFGCDGY